MGRLAQWMAIVNRAWRGSAQVHDDDRGEPEEGDAGGSDERCDQRGARRRDQNGPFGEGAKGGALGARDGVFSRYGPRPDNGGELGGGGEKLFVYGGDGEAHNEGVLDGVRGCWDCRCLDRS